jgi:hypothetical protein
MLLAVTILILGGSLSFNDNMGQTFSIYIISIAGAESVIGLSILVTYFKLYLSLISTCATKNYSNKVTKFKGSSRVKFSSYPQPFYVTKARVPTAKVRCYSMKASTNSTSENFLNLSINP